MNPEQAISLLLIAMFLGFVIPWVASKFRSDYKQPEPHPTHDTTKTQVIP